MRTRIASLGAALLLATAGLAGSAGTALMAIAPLTVTSPLETVQTGTTVMPWINLTPEIGQGYNALCIGVDVSRVPTTDTVTVLIEFTGDGGATVLTPYDYTLSVQGGVYHNRIGQVMPPSVCETLPPNGPSGMEVRATVTVPQSEQLQASATLYQN